MAHTAHLERAALLVLLRRRARGTSWADIVGDVLDAGSALAVLDRAREGALLNPELDAELESAMAEVSQWGAAGLRMLTVLDPDYPPRLLGIHQAPPYLFVEGELRKHDPAVSIVGSREASDRGLAIAAAVAESLVGVNLTVISGLAEGIDTAAHTAALKAGGRTVAVIGTGIRRHYPAKNKALQEEIAQRGLLLSQFLPDAGPAQQNFPMRNVTMSGYGIATFVVEAGERSGTRIQARVAVEHGRRVILSDLVANGTQWGKELVGRPGVHVAESTRDVLDILHRIKHEDEQALHADFGELAVL